MPPRPPRGKYTRAIASRGKRLARQAANRASASIRAKGGGGKGGGGGKTGGGSGPK